MATKKETEIVIPEKAQHLSLVDWKAFKCCFDSNQITIKSFRNYDPYGLGFVWDQIVKDLHVVREIVQINDSVIRCNWNFSIFILSLPSSILLFFCFCCVSVDVLCTYCPIIQLTNIRYPLYSILSQSFLIRFPFYFYSIHFSWIKKFSLW